MLQVAHIGLYRVNQLCDIADTPRR